MTSINQDDLVPEKLLSIRCLRTGDSVKPHKLLFLMTLARLYKENPERSRLFPLDDSLTTAFTQVAEEFFPGNPHGSILIEYPFYHLTTDGIWFLDIKDGKQSLFRKFADSPNMRLTYRRLEETVDGGRLEESLDESMRDPVGNTRIQALLSQRLAELSYTQKPLLGGLVKEKREPYSLFAHESEALSAIRLHLRAHNLGQTLNNLNLHDPQSNQYFETDLVVVAAFGVYVVELKHWSGRIEVRPNSWLQNSSFFKRDPHKSNNFKAKLLKGLYERKFPHFPSLYFESVVVLTNPDVEAVGCSIPKTEAHNPTFESIDRFLQYLKSQRKAKEQRLTGQQCQAFVDYVWKLNTEAPPRDFVFPGYEVVERLYQYNDRAEVIAKRTDIRHRRLSRLRVFYPPAGQESERKIAHERATATLNAVEKIGEHPNILKVWDVPNENNFLAEGSDWSEKGTLRDVLDRTSPLSAERAVTIAIGLARGLGAAHAQYVVHRAVSPDNVLMVNDTPKLMNFDLSFQLEEDRITVIPDVSLTGIMEPRMIGVMEPAVSGENGSLPHGQFSFFHPLSQV